MSSVILKNIRKSYDNESFAIHDFSITIADREFIVLVGPSGCGKSTVLNMIAGLEDITDGELFIDGELMNDVEPQSRNIAMVFQSYALYPHMSVFGNMAFALKLQHTPKAEIDSRVREAAEILGLTKYLDRKPKELSGGQRQRVAIGRAIVRKPKVFLMDEPLSNLDAKLRTQMRSEILKLRRRINTTFIYVTHDQTEAMTLGDRIVVMKDGRIQQTGTPQEVYSRPTNIFTAGFIGTPQMNFLDAELEIRDGIYCLNAGGVITVLPQDKQNNLRSVNPQPVTAGVRPEHITLGDGGKFSGTVDISEHLGSTIHLHVSTLGTDMIIAVQTMNAQKGFASGEKISYSLDGRFIHIFSKETGKNLERYDYGTFGL
ncbi:MAG: sn-glycerol-3-phosphate ABC transporter ATP-binding protein UgpC [Synergistaceae bacterium]|nr:sn-glycerol-3-phosphate ABC transporter ATP-binding protein UgpC [Synergistaceae bacterium]MBQ3653795.1 sn-glycerol-3-phosphate ABC transporter ATP-binding protein UgpC [Synergistaceae bacterium]